jgi:predicted phage-related endonuclease
VNDDLTRIERPIVSIGEWLRWRMGLLTASRIGALFDVHPHLTLAALVAEMRGERRGEGDNPSMRRGRILEPAVIAAVQEEHPEWNIVKASTFHIIPEHRLACTPDAFGDDGLLVQCKTVSPQQWELWHGRMPLHYVLQTLVELLVTGRTHGILAALVCSPGYPLHLFEVPRHEDAERRILDAAAAFWRKWDAGEHPQAQSAAGLAEMTDDGSYRDLSADNELPLLLEERHALKATTSSADKRLKEIDVTIKERIGPASTAWLPGWQLSWKAQERKEFTVPAATIRVLRVKATADGDEEDAA